MKRTVILLVAMAFMLTGHAEVYDAFKGIMPVTDKAVMKSLNGTWDLKVVKGIDGKKEVPAKDKTWGRIPVPGNWEQYGYCTPRYSFPDSLTGYYRTEFEVPQQWQGKRVVLRMDGVLRGYDLWINDQYVGFWEQCYNTCLWDITPYLKQGKQQLAMRIYSRYKGHEFDNWDDWAPMGIFRDVTLFCVPETHVSDFKVETVDVNAPVSAKVRFEIGVTGATAKSGVQLTARYPDGKVMFTTGAKPVKLDAEGKFIKEVTDKAAKLWNAETPYLYIVEYNLYENGKQTQHFTQKFGIRQITINDDQILCMNGTPIKLRGVNAHSTDPVTVKVIDEASILRDMKMMKEASVNYMRLSHYPREPRFFELCDSLGFYLVDEVPFGSRGEKNLSKPDYKDFLYTRAKATIDRDRNHPSVLIWSLGNENPLPKSCRELGMWVQEYDTSRPYCFPEKGSTFKSIIKSGDGHDFTKFPAGIPVHAPHYPATKQLKSLYALTDRPMVFTEYCHTLGIAFEDHDLQWETIEATPRIAGGSVWEWADQGMPFTVKSEELKDKSLDFYEGRYWGYEERVFTSKDGGFEMNGNQGTDGLVYADRTPLPNYYELQHNYSRAAVIDDVIKVNGNTVTLHVRNRYDFLNLKDNVNFKWSYNVNRKEVAQGSFSPDCAPRDTVEVNIELPLAQYKDGIQVLNVEISDKQGLVFLRQALRIKQGWSKVGTELAKRLSKDVVIDGTKPETKLIQEGPMARVGRKMTLAEALKVKDSRIERYLQPLSNPYVTCNLSYADGKTNYEFNGIKQEEKQRFLSEVGVAYLLDKSIDRVQWIGKGPYPTYPGRNQANRFGYWAVQKGDIYFEGNRMDVDAAWFSDAQGNGILIVADGSNINFEQTDKGIVVTVNAAVSGQGPKFARTAHSITTDRLKNKKGGFRMYQTKAGDTPRMFENPANVPAAFNPFLTQYDTYLMRYNDIIAK